MPTALLYCRVSTQEQVQEGYSLGAQERQLRAFCASQGWSVGSRYIEEGASGSKLGRPQIQALLRDLEAHVYPDPCVLVWRLDRLTRSVADLYTLLASFERLGATFRSATEPYDTGSAIGRLFVTLVAALAQWERENLIERSALGQVHQVTQSDDWYGGPAPFGYRVEGRRLVPNPEAAATVARIFDEFLTTGNLTALARALDRDGIPSPRGRQWSAVQLRYILRNPVYAGRRAWRKRTKTATSWRTTSRNEWVTADGHHQPIVPLATWEQAMATLEANDGASARRGWGQHPLTGLLRCGLCGRGMTGRLLHRGGRRTRTYRYYLCPNHYLRATCTMPSVPADGMETFVLQAIRDRHEEAALLEGARESGTEPDAIQALRARADGVRRRVARWESAFEAEAITASELARHLGRLREEEVQLTDQIRALARPRDHKPPSAPGGPWEALTAAQRKSFLRELIQRITVFPDSSVDIAWV